MRSITSASSRSPTDRARFKLLLRSLSSKLPPATPSFFDIAADVAAQSIRVSSFAASGILFAKTTKSGGATKKNKIGPQRTRERVSFPPTAVDSISGGETSSKPQRERRDGRTKPNLLCRFARSAGTKFSTRNWRRQFEKVKPKVQSLSPPKWLCALRL